MEPEPTLASPGALRRHPKQRTALAPPGAADARAGAGSWAEAVRPSGDGAHDAASLDSVARQSRSDSAEGAWLTTAERSRGTATKSLRDADGAGGGALSMSDAELVSMLRKKPKHVPQLQTRQGFQRFFAGVEHRRMAALLAQAYSDMPDAEVRVQKRLALLREVMS